MVTRKIESAVIRSYIVDLRKRATKAAGIVLNPVVGEHGKGYQKGYAAALKQVAKEMSKM